MKSQRWYDTSDLRMRNGKQAIGEKTVLLPLEGGGGREIYLTN